MAFDCAQYNVTVIGRDDQGKNTTGSNMLQFTTPAAPPPPAPFRCAVRLSLRHLNCACMAWPHMLLGRWPGASWWLTRVNGPWAD